MSYENSPLEQALSEYVLVLSKWMRSHDRYVIIAFIASLIPFPPAGIASIFLSLIQLKLIRENKLPESSRKILHISILFSLTNFFLFGSIVYWVFRFYIVGYFLLSSLAACASKDHAIYSSAHWSNVCLWLCALAFAG